MKILHRIGFVASDAQRTVLHALGVKLRSEITMPGGADPFVAFDIAENDGSWLQIRALLQRWGISEGAVRTEFSRSEVETARWLDIGAWHHGYPQPDEDVFGYRQATYDLTEWCGHCGVGKRQKAPFQMKGEPRWGRNSVLQLTWIYDELFVKPEVWASVFRPAGIGARPVTNRKGHELTTVVQLAIDEKVSMATEGLPTERCGTCNRVKYLQVTRGPLPRLNTDPSGAMARTSEYFGSGAQADHLLLVSQTLARALAAERVRGTYYRPVRSTNPDS